VLVLVRALVLVQGQEQGLGQAQGRERVREQVVAADLLCE
jgi:hypothetical protein